MDIILHDPVLRLAALSVLGLLIGSFLNVVIHRVPVMMENSFRHECSCLDLPADSEYPPPPRYNLVSPRSACPHCGHAISALENIPVFSWLFLGGKCRQCKAPISIRYPLVELLTAIVSGWIAWRYGASWQMAGALLFAWFLIALIFIDADTSLLPDSLTLPLVWLGLLFNLGGTFVSLNEAVIGAMAGYLSLWCVFWLFKLLTGKEGMGYGDFKLLAALGAWLGWKMLPAIILLSSITGAVLGIVMILLARHGFGKPMPFGPYLGIAGFIAMHWGAPLLGWYGF
ncbi:leader peptidase (prepilin peptidase) / N-methyltransferase [Formivibrio citricus]|uniref:Prepilin leader peptidase/N-methyltransferase n=1 Tax=Formivibrio citricus TaxID=83765 RepID=A0A1I4ZPB9_9NEIS|nr:A24 family peptidase [Formivibrio citricus]SFN52094.1 leader peptidase (prepilin peptidase) / N-methyltransferase [Formivibrio citricus]